MEAVMIRPLVKVESLEVGDPEFEAGSVHTARATLTNPTMKQFTYDVELYLDVTKVASASGTITIPAGSSVPIDFIVTMPLVEGTFDVWVDAWYGTELLVHYHATEKVTVGISPAIIIGEPVWVS